VFGGSQGLARINQAVIAATAHWPDPAAVQVLHACGRRDEADVRAAWAEADPDGPRAAGQDRARSSTAWTWPTPPPTWP
jgi:hypothetical protein